MALAPFFGGFYEVFGPGIARLECFGQGYAKPPALVLEKRVHGDPLVADTAISRHMLLAVAVNSAWARVFLNPK